MNIYILIIAYTITFLILCFFGSILVMKECGECKNKNKKTHIALMVGIIAGTIINPFVIPVCVLVFLLMMFLIGGEK